MGVSTNAILCYGVSFDEDYEFPWDDGADSDYDIEKWWLEVNGYSRPFQLFTEDGHWIDGVEAPDDKVTEYFAHKREFLTCHPLLVKLVMHCSGDFPMFILATPGSVREAYRGYPKRLVPDLVYNEQEEKDLLEFCQKWGLEGELGWWLCSLWVY